MAEIGGCEVAYLAAGGFGGIEALAFSMVVGGLVAAAVLIGRMVAPLLARESRVVAEG